LAAFQVITYGRFWVFTEAVRRIVRNLKFLNIGDRLEGTCWILLPKVFANELRANGRLRRNEHNVFVHQSMNHQPMNGLNITRHPGAQPLAGKGGNSTRITHTPAARLFRRQILFGYLQSHAAGYSDNIILPDRADQLMRGPWFKTVICDKPTHHIGGG
jgi:hypothetical protein